MNIVHLESGLGNQMLNYAEYLALKSVTNADCYIEMMLYDIPECSEGISQWNGYELEKIFGVKVPNIRHVLGEKAYSEVLHDVKKSRFWEKHWNYPPYIVEALKKQGINVEAVRGELHLPPYWMKCSQTEPYPKQSVQHQVKEYFYNTRMGYGLRHNLQIKFRENLCKKYASKDRVFIQDADGLFLSHCLNLSNKYSGIEEIEEQIKREFTFPEISDDYNKKMADLICNTNSVSIHVRRGDFALANEVCYKYGYFKRAVSYILNHVDNPSFFIFTDPASISWCKENLDVLGIQRVSNVYYVDGNKGANSFRDMQLMSLCNHNIVTKSSFGWWGAFLNAHPDKITCSPNITTYTTNVF